MLRTTLTFLLLVSTFFIWSQERYPNGQIKSEGDEKNGIYTEYFENGNILKKTDRRSIKRLVFLYEGYENGQTKVVNTIHVDSVSDEHKEYYETGRLKKKGNYVVKFITNEKGDTSKIISSADGICTWYGPKGDSTYLLMDKGKYAGTGRVIEYYFNGQKESNIYYVNGQPKGEVLKYYESGQLEYRSYKIDENIKQIISYYENGNMKSIEYYKNKIPVGESFWYHWEGQVKTWITHCPKTGNPVKESEYDPNGTIIKKTIYKKRDNKTAYYYDKEGKLFRIFKIRRRKLLEVVTDFDKNGKKIKKQRHRSRKKQVDY